MRRSLFTKNQAHMSNFTSDQLLLHYFGELDELSASGMEDLLATTPVLKKEYTELSESIKAFGLIELQPSEQAMTMVLLRLGQDSGVHLV